MAFRDGEQLHFPWLIGQCVDGGWFAFSDRYFSIGHPGGGPGSTLHALTSLGLEEELAERIAYSATCDVDLGAGEGPWTFGGPHDPHVVPPTTIRPRGPVYVAIIPVWQEYGQDRPADADLREWLEFLDQGALPEWMRVPRRVRAWLDA